MPITHVVSKPKKEKTKSDGKDEPVFDDDFTKKHGKLRDNRQRKSRKEY